MKISGENESGLSYMSILSVFFGANQDFRPASFNMFVPLCHVFFFFCWFFRLKGAISTSPLHNHFLRGRSIDQSVKPAPLIKSTDSFFARQACPFNTPNKN